MTLAEWRLSTDDWFSTEGWFDHPVTRGIVLGVGVALILAPLVAFALSKAGLMGEKTRRDVLVRWMTWMLVAPGLVLPILWCKAATIAMVCVASLLCYREFARATGLFRERVLSALVGVAIILLALSNLDNWYGLFMALHPLTVVVLAGVGVLKDQPKGYIQRVSLACVGFLLFGVGLGHLGFIANDPNYRPILALLLLASQASDIFAYICGKSFGRRNLFANTSPNKTLGGHLGAFLIIAPGIAYASHLVFEGTAMDRWWILAGLGALCALGAQLGDLVLGSIKRDLGIKDMSAILPGHGGFLDRFNSLLLISPAAFHYIQYFGGFNFPMHMVGGVAP